MTMYEIVEKMKQNKDLKVAGSLFEYHYGKHKRDGDTLSFGILVGMLSVLSSQGCITDVEADVIDEKLWSERNKAYKCTE